MKHIFRTSKQQQSETDKLSFSEATPLLKSQAVSDVIMEVQEVQHIYSTGTHALKGVSMNIPRGQVFGLLGSNGSGKSTLMHCLAGIYKPTSGKAILLNGNDVDLFKQRQVSRFFSVVP